MKEIPCLYDIMPICKPKECNVEFCPIRQEIMIKKLAEVEGGWASFALALLKRVKERKALSKTKKQKRDEASN